MEWLKLIVDVFECVFFLMDIEYDCNVLKGIFFIFLLRFEIYFLGVKFDRVVKFFLKIL